MTKIFFLSAREVGSPFSSFSQFRPSIHRIWVSRSSQRKFIGSARDMPHYHVHMDQSLAAQVHVIYASCIDQLREGERS